MKTLNKIIIAVVLMASFVSYSYGQEPKVIITEEYENGGMQYIKAIFDDGMEMSFYVGQDALILASIERETIPASGKVIIPSQIESKGIKYEVGGIDDQAFAYCPQLTSVIIPTSVKYIGGYAFYDCSGLASVTIPNSTAIIAQVAFSRCTSLTSIVIPNSVTRIFGFTFADCSGLTSVVIPNSVTEIGEGTFLHCSSLTSIDIPNSVKRIEMNTFSGCAGLTSVIIPKSVKYIGSEAFAECTSLTSVIIPNGVKCIDTEGFAGCTRLTSITIPESVTEIGRGAFSRCSNLTSVVIQNPNLILDFDRIFSGCDKLQRSNVVYQNATNANNERANKNNSQTKSTQVNKGNTAIQTKDTNAEIFTIVEQMPSFPGGDKALSEFISINIRYPQAALDKGVQGHVFVSFVVEPDGSLSDVKATRGIGSGCDEEAVRVVKSMPKWEPGKQRGQAVRVSYNLPVNFKLPK